MRKKNLLFLISITLSFASFSQEAKQEESEIGIIAIHPLHKLDYKSSNHYAGQFNGSLGDELGKDVLIIRYEKKFPKFFQNSGKVNKDWYGWNQEVLAPFSGKVVEVYINPVTNIPGDKGEGHASRIVFERMDGVKVLFGHVQNIQVKEGDIVTGGQTVAYVGNNGYAWMPHIHVGAWKGKKPLQIIFDLELMGELQREQNK